MKVSELIKQLLEYPQDSEVYHRDFEYPDDKIEASSIEETTCGFKIILE